MSRRALLGIVLLLLVGAAAVHAAERLKIVPLVQEKEVLVTMEIAEGYTDEVREMIASGLRTTFTYEIELRMVVVGWVDRTVATALVSITDDYDNLTRRHTLSRAVDGRIYESLVTDDEEVVREWLTKVVRVPLCSTSELEPNREYYVRVSARKRPQRSFPLAWTSLSGQANFTFIP